MLTLEDPECKDFSKNAIEDEETNETRNDGESYERDSYLVNGEILRTALLSADDDDIESQEDDVSSEDRKSVV